MNCRRFAGGCWDHEVECARLAGSWRHGVSGAEAAKGGGDVVHSLEAAPQGLGSRLAIGFAGEKAGELGDGADHLAQRGRLLGWWLTGLEDDDGLPLIVVKGDGARQIGGGAAQPRQIVDMRQATTASIARQASRRSAVAS